MTTSYIIENVFAIQNIIPKNATFYTAYFSGVIDVYKHLVNLEKYYIFWSSIPFFMKAIDAKDKDWSF